jgi:hypothetical protein
MTKYQEKFQFPALVLYTMQGREERIIRRRDRLKSERHRRRKYVE